MQSPEVGDFVGQEVVLNDAPELRLVPADDGVILVIVETCATHRLAVAHVGVAVLFDDFGGNSQTNSAIDFSLPMVHGYSATVVRFVAALDTREQPGLHQDGRGRGLGAEFLGITPYVLNERVRESWIKPMFETGDRRYSGYVLVQLLG